MSNEPSLNLGRLIAAERNAITALSGQKTAENKLVDMTRRLDQTQAQLAFVQEQITALQVRLAGIMGSGPTG
jgi:hypothetical protein